MAGIQDEPAVIIGEHPGGDRFRIAAGGDPSPTNKSGDPFPPFTSAMASGPPLASIAAPESERDGSPGVTADAARAGLGVLVVGRGDQEHRVRSGDGAGGQAGLVAIGDLGFNFGAGEAAPAIVAESGQASAGSRTDHQVFRPAVRRGDPRDPGSQSAPAVGQERLPGQIIERGIDVDVIQQPADVLEERFDRVRGTSVGSGLGLGSGLVDFIG